jgi:hypothetical protein
MSKMIFLKKKHYFDVFPNKKYFEKQPLPQYQTGSSSIVSSILLWSKF